MFQGRDYTGRALKKTQEDAAIVHFVKSTNKIEK